MKFNYGVAIEKFDLTEAQNVKSLFVHGTAIKEVVSRNGVKYVAKELEKAAPGLKGKPILKDHKNDVDHIIGKVIDSSYDAVEKSIKFRGLIADEKVQSLILNGLLNHVSIGAQVTNMREESNDDGKAMVAEGLEILELSVTPVPGVPTASIMPGEGFAVALQEAYETQHTSAKEVIVIEKVHCPECEKTFDSKDDMMAHKMKAHEKQKEEVKSMEENESVTLAKMSIVEAILAFDTAWTKEELQKCDLNSLTLLLSKAKNKVRTEEKAVPKGMVSSPVAEKKEETLVCTSEDSLRGIKSNQFVIESGTKGRINFWKMPDYSKQGWKK